VYNLHLLETRCHFSHKVLTGSVFRISTLKIRNMQLYWYHMQFVLLDAICLFLSLQFNTWKDVKGKKVKWSRYRPRVAQRMGRGIALHFHDRGTRRGWVVSSTPRPHFTRYPIYRRLGGPQGRSGRAENLVPTGNFWLVYFTLSYMSFIQVWT
jgi:hypothetical protein